MSQPSHSRLHRRWYLGREDLPTEQQSGGVAVTLYRNLFFPWPLCKAIVKDVSLGGAGALVPADKKVPGKVKVVFAEGMSLTARIVHRQPISEKLLFLGLDWTREPDSKRRALLNLLMNRKYKAVNKSQAEEVSS